MSCSILHCTRCQVIIEEKDSFDYAGDPHCEQCYDVIEEMRQMCRYDDIENPDYGDDSSQPDDES